MAEHILVCITSSSPPEAEKLGQALVENRLAASAHIIADIRSIFWWKDTLETKREALLMLRSRSALFPEITKMVRAFHSYEVPEIIAFPIILGSEDFLSWIDEETQTRLA